MCNVAGSLGPVLSPSIEVTVGEKGMKESRRISRLRSVATYLMFSLMAATAALLLVSRRFGRR